MENVEEEGGPKLGNNDAADPCMMLLLMLLVSEWFGFVQVTVPTIMCFGNVCFRSKKGGVWQKTRKRK